MIARERAGTFYKTLAGKGWLVLEPLAHMSIYYFLIVIIFERTGPNGISPFVMIMTGLTHYLFLQKTLAGSCRAILGNEGLLLQIPMEPIIFSAVNFFKNIYNFCVTLILFGLVYIWLGPAGNSNLYWYPVCLAMLIMIAWLWSVILSILTVYFRDLQNLVTIFLRLLMYLSPVIYSLSFVPDVHWGLPVKNIYLLNPIGCMFALLQWSLLGGESPPQWAVSMLIIFILFSMCLSYIVYKKLRPYLTKSF